MFVSKLRGGTISGWVTAVMFDEHDAAAGPGSIIVSSHPPDNVESSATAQQVLVIRVYAFVLRHRVLHIFVNWLILL